MLLAIDIGNSSTVLGVFVGERLVHSLRYSTTRTAGNLEIKGELLSLIETGNIAVEKLNLMAVASVVPELIPAYESAASELSIKSLIITTGLKLPIKMGYHTPETLGVDRLANAVAAYARYGGPIIVVDYGTAIKFDVVTDNGIYLGGAIAPGPVTAGAELANRAAQLYEVDIARPEKVIGRNTMECLKSGLFWGTVGQVDHIIQLIQKEMSIPARVIATGGLATKFANESRLIETTLPNLTLEGIRIIAEFQAP